MYNFIKTFLPIFLGGLISGAIGIFIACHNRRKDAESNYLIAMLRLKDEAEKTSRDRSGKEFFHSTLNRVEDAVFRLQVVLPRCPSNMLMASWHEFEHIPNSKELIGLWHEYRAIPDSKLKAENEGGSDALAAQCSGGAAPEKPSKILTDYFTRFIKILVNKHAA